LENASAFKNVHQLRGDAQFSTWLGSIVLNAASMQLRRRINHALVSLDEQSKEGVPIWPERLQDSARTLKKLFVKRKRVRTWSE